MRCFADDPVAFFEGASLFAHHLSLVEQENLQLECLRQRFATLRDALPPLQALADASRIEQIEKIEDVAPLLFPHTLHKSYPQRLIDELRFPELTEWVSRLTVNDLSAVKGRDFNAIDHWMDALDEETALQIVTSSGTTNTPSLYPRGKSEVEMLKKRVGLAWNAPGSGGPTEKIEVFPAFWLSYAKGRSGMVRGGELLRDIRLAASIPFISLFPESQSTDWQIHVARVQAALQSGQPPPKMSPYLEDKKMEANDIHRAFDDRIRSLLRKLQSDFSATAVNIIGSPMLAYRVAAEGLRLGMEPGLAPGSYVSGGGGMKGVAKPADMDTTMRRFGGPIVFTDTYGMSELTDAFRPCDHGVYHIWPWVIPLVFDGERHALLPRRGKQTGRAAFVDLSAQTYWGGVVSADQVTMSWDRCPCGRTTPQVLPPIVRIPAAEHRGHVLGGATPKAIDAALQALNGGLA